MVYDKRHIKRRGCEVEREKSRTLCSRRGGGPKSQGLESVLCLYSVCSGERGCHRKAPRKAPRSTKWFQKSQVITWLARREARHRLWDYAVPVNLSSLLLQDGPLPDLPTPTGHSSQPCRGHCDQNLGPISLESTDSYLSLEHTVKVTLTPNPDSRREL